MRICGDRDIHVPSCGDCDPTDEGKVMVDCDLVEQTSIEVTENGTYDTTTNNEVVVDVAGSLTPADEGKVVQNGALVSQTPLSITANGVYDTTINNEVDVNVSGGITPTGNINITDTQVTDVTSYATAQVVDSDLVASNIKKNVNILGVVGTYEGGGMSENDILFHFDNNYNNSGHINAVFFDANGLTISNEQSKFGGYSLKCGTTQTYDNVAMDFGFAFGSDDFTLDFWVYPTNLSTGTTFKVPVSFKYRSIAFYISQAYIEFGLAKTNSSWFNTATIPATITNNAWHHIALVRNGTEIYGFLDGIKMQTISFGNDALAPTQLMSLGSNTYNSGDRRLEGYIDELRIIIGQAVWTDDFTPPTQPYV